MTTDSKPPKPLLPPDVPIGRVTPDGRVIIDAHWREFFEAMLRTVAILQKEAV